MTRKTLLFTALLLLLGTVVAGAVETTKKPKEKAKIKLEQARSSLRSTYAIDIEAYQDGTLLEIVAADYSGPAYVEILGSSIARMVQIDSTGYATVDISQLPEGTYTLRITIDGNVIEGTIYIE